MTFSKRIISLMLLVFMIVASFSVSAHATNEDLTLSGTTRHPDAYYSDVASKDDTSTHYVYIHTSNATYTFVDSVGVHSDGTRGYRCTMSDGDFAVSVSLRTGVKYNVHNLIYEHGFRKVQLECRALYTSMTQYITGEWSADSVGSYNVAT